MEHNIDTSHQYELILKLIDEKLFKLLATNNAFVAGGAISSLFTNRPINDLDLFFPTEANYKNVEHYFNNYGSWNNLYDSTLAHTYERKEGLAYTDPVDYGTTLILDKYKVQLVHCVFGDVNEIFDSFDFYCCMGAFLFKTNEFKFHPNFIGDNLSRNLRLHYDGNSNPLSSLMRVEKYKTYGYKIKMEEIFKLVLMLKKIKLDTMGDLKAALRYVPVGFFKKVIMNELFDKPLTKLNIVFNNTEGKQKYADFMNSPCDFDAIVGIINDLPSFVDRNVDAGNKDNKDNTTLFGNLISGSYTPAYPVYTASNGNNFIIPNNITVNNATV